MRWDRLFDDLEAQLDAAASDDLAGEVADRTRRELAQVQLADRLVAWVGQPLVVQALGSQRIEGRLAECAQEWLVVTAPGPVLVPMASVTGVLGLGAGASTTGRSGVARRLPLTAALRAVARDRSPVRVDLVDGSSVIGTVDSVGADHLDVAEHPADEPRRARAVRGVRTVPLGALAAVRPYPGTTSL